MKSKKGQLTLFIIIAIVIIGVVITFFTFRGGIKIEKMNPNAEEVYSFVEECINDVGSEAVYEIGARGGYYISPEFSTDTAIPYYYDFETKKSYMPTKEKIGKEIEEFVEGNLIFCTNNFVQFIDFDIISNDVGVDAEIMDGKVILNVNYPISITKEESTSIINEFKDIEIPVRLGIIYDAIVRIIQEQLKEDMVCLSCLEDIAVENDLVIDTVDYDDETTVFIFKDENSIINEEEFEFLFANRYVK